MKSALEAIGVGVESHEHLGDGVLDLLCIHAGRVVRLEVKTQSGKLNSRQLNVIAKWKFHGGEAVVVRDVAQALAVFGVS